MQQADLSLVFLRPLNQLGLRYVVAGSTAAMLYSEPRFTNDLDLVVFLRHEDIRRLAEAFPQPDFYVPPEEVIAAEIARPQKGQFNVLHMKTGFKADCYTTGRDDFNAWAFRHARRMEFKGESISVAPPECVIVRKLEFLREGGSDKHVRDIRAMLMVSGEKIDLGALREWVARQGVEAEWRRVQL
jgi:hypothetical protein